MLRILLLALGLAAAEVFAQDPGRIVFTQTAQPACALCHTLADAGSSAEIGPDLDQLKPTAEQVVTAVRYGVGIMPAFEESLSEAEIDAVAQYVARVTGADLNASNGAGHHGGGKKMHPP
ncbi:SorU family sulfite dehydrogenase c-type cytochrome subunit [Marinobacter bohaiensis]|uniref:SorU family sulfite dehydrogenase c-type cytochrome subunit n=1 Tax=Marinobacter bohaiensis TaxID=2201898 RepID=UPI000DABEDAE|nr:cytochrome c [Marinobacter bohaiensis]